VSRPNISPHPDESPSGPGLELSPDDELTVGAPPADPVEALALRLIRAGRVVPSLTVEPDGRARSWWWPLPTGVDRADLLRLLDDGTIEGQARLAYDLAAATDRLARGRLMADEVALLPPRPGRRPVPDAWVRSLAAEDPWLSPSLPADRVRGLAADLAEWIADGADLPASVRLALRVIEPPLVPADEAGVPAADEPAMAPPDLGGLLVPADEWSVELLVEDTDGSSITVPFVSLFDGAGAFGPGALEDGLRVLGRLVRAAPELGSLLDSARPDRVEFSTAQVLDLVRERSIPLAEVGVRVLLPKWWAARPKLGLRAQVDTGEGDESLEGGFGLDEMAEFSWAVALGDEPLSAADLELLAQAVAANQQLVQLRGQWITIDPAQLEAMLARIDRNLSASAGDLVRAGLGMADLDGVTDDDLDILGVDAGGWLGDILNDAVHARVEPVAQPPGFAGQLRPYQQRGVGWLRFLGRLGLGACLADDMGLGKTAQLIGALLESRSKTGPGKGSVPSTLVICPVSVLGNWRREIERFAPELSVVVHHGPNREREVAALTKVAEDHDVVITSYSLVDRDSEPLGAIRWGWLVLDEAQQVKNPGTKAARAVRALQAERRVALTGTPVENRLAELWSIMQFLNPGLLGSRQSFRERFGRPIEVDQDADATNQLRKITSPFVLRRLKTDRSIITDLPDKIETVDHCPLTREQVSLYQAVVDDLIEAAADADGMTRRGLVLAGLMRLKQICNHPAHYLDDGSSLPGRSGKLARVEELLEEILAAGDKVLGFTQFTTWGDRLHEYLPRRFGAETLWLHGGVSQPDREDMVERFSRDDGPPIMLLSIRAGGTGLNLVSASHVIHLDRWWNPAVEDQATDRAYRIGQTQNVQVHKLVSVGTVEERIDAMIQSKRDLADRVVGTGEQWITELDTNELASLIRLEHG